jgi:hypothetical protein
MNFVYRSDTDFDLMLRCQQCGKVYLQVQPIRGDIQSSILYYAKEQHIHACSEDVFGIAQVIGGTYVLSKV